MRQWIEKRTHIKGAECEFEKNTSSSYNGILFTLYLRSPADILQGQVVAAPVRSFPTKVMKTILTSTLSAHKLEKRHPPQLSDF